MEEIAQDEYREMEFILYNCRNLDKVIDTMKDSYYDNIKVTSNSWYRSLQEEGNTLEDQVAKVLDNTSIIRLQKWNKIIQDYFIELKKQNIDAYNFVIDRYVNKINSRAILIKLNGNKSKFKELKEDSLKLLFSFAVNQGLFSSKVIAQKGEVMRKCKVITIANQKGGVGKQQQL